MRHPHAITHRQFLAPMQPQPLVILGALVLALMVMIVQVLLQLRGAPDFLTDVIGLSILVGALAFAQVLDRRMGVIGAVLAGGVAAIVPGVPTIPLRLSGEMLVRLLAFAMMSTVYYVVVLALRRRDERAQRQLVGLQALYGEVRGLHAITDRVPIDRTAIEKQIIEATIRLTGAWRGRLVLYNNEGELVAAEAIWPPGSSRTESSLPPIVPIPAGVPYIVTPLKEGGKQISVALTGEHGTIGVLHVEQQVSDLGARDAADLLAVYAGDAALALEHVILRERLDFLLVMEERARIARDLHDGLAQALGGIGYRLEYYRQTLTPDTVAPMLQELETTGVAIRDALRDARQMIHGLRDPVSTEESAMRLQTLLATIAGETGVLVSVDLPDSLPPLSPALADTIHAVAREALQNVVKHAGAETVSLALLTGPEFIEMTISDDGCGFTNTGRFAQESPPRYGLVGMAERAAQQGGTLTIQTAPEMGANVTLTLPLAEGGQ